jgi:hypothetical protein
MSIETYEGIVRNYYLRKYFTFENLSDYHNVLLTMGGQKLNKLEHIPISLLVKYVGAITFFLLGYCFKWTS